MGDVIWLIVVMLIVAGVAFAPLGYFIRKYTNEDQKQDQQGNMRAAL